MSDYLHHQVAAAIKTALPGISQELSAVVASTVIAELGLHAETNYGTTYPTTPVTDQRYTRYVTPWQANSCARCNHTACDHNCQSDWCGSIEDTRY